MVSGLAVQGPHHGFRHRIRWKSYNLNETVHSLWNPEASRSIHSRSKLENMPGKTEAYRKNRLFYRKKWYYLIFFHILHMQIMIAYFACFCIWHAYNLHIYAYFAYSCGINCAAYFYVLLHIIFMYMHVFEYFICIFCTYSAHILRIFLHILCIY